MPCNPTSVLGGLVTSKLAVNLLVPDAPLLKTAVTQEFYCRRGTKKRGKTMDNLDLDRNAFAKGIPLLAIVLIGMVLAISFFL